MLVREMGLRSTARVGACSVSTAGTRNVLEQGGVNRVLAGVVTEGGAGQGSEEGNDGRGRAALRCGAVPGQLWECKADTYRGL